MKWNWDVLPHQRNWNRHPGEQQAMQEKKLTPKNTNELRSILHLFTCCTVNFLLQKLHRATSTIPRMKTSKSLGDQHQKWVDSGKRLINKGVLKVNKSDNLTKQVFWITVNSFSLFTNLCVTNVRHSGIVKPSKEHAKAQMGSSSWLVPLVNSPSFGAHKGMTFQKGEVAHFVAHCTEATLCIRGNKKKGILGDTREIQTIKMTRRKHLLQRKNGIKFHFTRCLKCSNGSTHILDAVECLLTSLLRWSPILCWWKCWLGIDWKINLCSPKKVQSSCSTIKKGKFFEVTCSMIELQKNFQDYFTWPPPLSMNPFGMSWASTETKLCTTNTIIRCIKWGTLTGMRIGGTRYSTSTAIRFEIGKSTIRSEQNEVFWRTRATIEEETLWRVFPNRIVWYMWSVESISILVDNLSKKISWQFFPLRIARNVFLEENRGNSSVKHSHRNCRVW